MEPRRLGLQSFVAVAIAVMLSGCGGGGGGASTSAPSNLTVTGTAATGLAISGAALVAKCASGVGSATTSANGSFNMLVTGGQLPCVLQIVNPMDGTKLHSVAIGSGSTATANITPLTEMTTARALGSEPNVFFAAFDASISSQKLTTAKVAAAQTDVDLVLAGTIDTTGIVDFISTPLVAATQDNSTSGDTQDKLLDALMLKLTRVQIGLTVTALAGNQTTDSIKQSVIAMTSASIEAPTARAGLDQSVVVSTTVTLDASTSSAAAGSVLTYAWTLTTRPVGSSATLTSSTSAKPTFVADVAGSYVASVIVNDGITNSSADAVTVNASVANAAPVANAGVSQNVVTGTSVTLDGSASSDANSDPLSFAWTLTSKPLGSTASLSSPSSAKPTFTADVAGTYVALLTVNDGKINSSQATANVTAVAPTPIGGIVSTDTHLTASNSPYLLTSDLQVAYGVTLTVDPGVRVVSTGASIKVYGTLKVAGTSSSYVQFDAVPIYNSGTSNAEVSLIEIAYAKINGGSIYAPTGNGIYGSLSLTDSVLTGVGSYMYLWYPVKDSFIERNVFKNSGGISVGVDTRSTPTKVYIRNNVFSGVVGDAVANWASYGGETTVVSANSFLDTGKVVLRLPAGYSSAAMTATGNYWGTSDQAQIQTRIYDKTNDLSSAGVVPFLPILTQPDALTPSYP